MGRDKIKELIAQCTQGQQDLFKRCYPSGIDNIPDENVSSAISLCERTIEKNKRKDNV